MHGYKKGQGAQSNPTHRFSAYQYEEDTLENSVENKSVGTQYLEVFPKTIVNKVESPDIPLKYSMNPYQGCEHGCTYCYARPTHEYWNYSPGLDFERVILVKKNAAELLEKEFQKKNYTPSPIMLSGNTDCYQPAEKEFELTRKMLEVCLKYKHPVSIITKNTLLKRDLPILVEMSKYQLVHIHLSITTLDENLRRALEPRTATSAKKLALINELSTHQIPSSIMVAPIIPGLNSHEILPILKAASEAGAQNFGYTLVRLSSSVRPVFQDWIEKVFPDKANKVMNQIKAIHQGKFTSTQFGERMKGHGPVAQSIHQTLSIGRKKYFPNPTPVVLSTQHFTGPNPQQLTLF